MSNLQQIAQSNFQWSLEAFVQTVNELLPQFLPRNIEAPRHSEALNPRLVRHYTTQGLLDKPLRQGREVRYEYRHLLQLLVVRRLLAEGLTVRALGALIADQPNSALEALLQGGVQLSVESANPALAFLQQVRSRTASSLPARSSSETRQKKQGASAAPIINPDFKEVSRSENQEDLPQLSKTDVSRLYRIEVLPGLEIQISDAFVYPASPQEQANLLQLMAQKLVYLLSQRTQP